LSFYIAETPDGKVHYATGYTEILRKVKDHLDARPHQDWRHMRQLPRRIKPADYKEFQANRDNPLWWILNHQGTWSNGKRRLVAKMLKEYSPNLKEYSPPKEYEELLRPLAWNPEGHGVDATKPYTCPDCGGSMWKGYDGYWHCKCEQN